MIYIIKNKSERRSIMISFFNKKKIINIIAFILLFFLFLYWDLIIQPISIDEVWNYGFAHNISNGLLPYKDFNIVLTPLYPFIMAIGLKIFGSSMLVFHIEHALVLTAFFIALFRLINKRAYIVLLFCFFPMARFFPSYNMFYLLLFSLLLLFEKEEKSDYLIGFIVGLILLTKQSIGFIFCVTTFYYLFLGYKKKFIKRIIGIFIPFFIFFIYLLVSNSLFEFLDLCVMGLFDFGNSNTSRAFELRCFMPLLVLFIYLIYCLKKNPKSIYNYYSLSGLFIVFPLIDSYHFYIGFLSFLIVFLIYHDNFSFIRIPLFTISILVLIVLTYSCYRFSSNDFLYPNTLSHFEYRFIDKNSIKFTKDVLNYMDKHSNKEFIFLNSNAYFFRIIRNERITYKDLINEGNWGYHTNKKIMNKLIERDAIYFLQEEDLDNVFQICKDIMYYVIKHGKEIDFFGKYHVYVLNS